MRSDVLFFTLRSLKIGEGIDCTGETFCRIKGRVRDFVCDHAGYKFVTRVNDGVAHIRRVA